MSDTSSDDILDGLVEDVEENLNESDVDEEVDVDEDILEALEGGLAEQASDADDVRSYSLQSSRHSRLTRDNFAGF
jgi:hypothetical protein